MPELGGDHLLYILELFGGREPIQPIYPNFVSLSLFKTETSSASGKSFNF